MSPAPIPGGPDPAGIPKIDSATAHPLTSGPAKPGTTPTTSFEQIIQRAGPEGAEMGGTPPSGAVSPESLAGLGRPVGVSAHEATGSTVFEALENATSQNQGLQTRLQQTNVNDLSRSQQFMLNQKLSSANDHIQSAANRAGVDTSKFGQPTAVPGGPIGKFLNMLSEGQQMLTSARNQIPLMADAGTIKPGDFLAIQMKMSVAQIDLDFASQILGKTSDALSKLMNINI